MGLIYVKDWIRPHFYLKDIWWVMFVPSITIVYAHSKISKVLFGVMNESSLEKFFKYILQTFDSRQKTNTFCKVATDLTFYANLTLFTPSISVMLYSFTFSSLQEWSKIKSVKVSSILNKSTVQKWVVMSTTKTLWWSANKSLSLFYSLQSFKYLILDIFK